MGVYPGLDSLADQVQPNPQGAPTNCIKNTTTFIPGLSAEEYVSFALFTSLLLSLLFFPLLSQFLLPRFSQILAHDHQHPHTFSSQVSRELSRDLSSSPQ